MCVDGEGIHYLSVHLSCKVGSAAALMSIVSLFSKDEWQTTNKKSPRKCSGTYCPSWARTRTLLIQSQACCQLHQGAVLKFFRTLAGTRNLKPLRPAINIPEMGVSTTLQISFRVESRPTARRRYP